MSTPGNPAPRSTVLCGAWANPDDVPETDRSLLSDDQWPRYLTAASEVLFALSGRQWSGPGCTDVVELRTRPPAPGTGAWPYYRTWGNGAPEYWWWAWAGWAWFPHYLGQRSVPYAIKLPRTEITAVTSVTVDGEAFTDWRLLPSGWIERTDGRSWRELDGDTVITYLYGTPPPEFGVMAAVKLAVELAKAATGAAGCQLPKRISSITRQGVSMTLLDPKMFLEDGRTGIYEIDLFLAAVNPSSRTRAASVWSPDIPRAT